MTCLSYLVGTLQFLLQFHFIFPLPQHFLAKGRKARSCVLQLEKNTINEWRLYGRQRTTNLQFATLFGPIFFLPCLFVIRHQVRLELPLGPVFREIIVGDLGHLDVGYLGGSSLHSAAGCPFRVRLLLGFQGFSPLTLLSCLWVKRWCLKGS